MCFESQIYLKDAGEVPNESIPQTEHYVLDGGSLLHRVPWKKGSSYGAIAKLYADFTNSTLWGGNSSF